MERNRSIKAASVSCFLPDAFIAHLRALPRATPDAPAASATKRSRGGRAIKANHLALPPKVSQAKEAEAIKALTEAMRRKKRDAAGDSP